MRVFLNDYFRIAERHSTIHREVVAGITTFLTVSYIIIVNPAILEAAGIPKGPSTVATILSAALGTLLMGLYAGRPFAVAPYMGENAFIAYTVVGVLGYSWQTALGAVFIGGVLFVLLTVLRVRSWLVQAIPLSLKFAFAVGIGLFLTLIGLVTTGLVKVGVPAAPVQVGALTNVSSLLAILGFLSISVLIALRVRGSMLYGILGITVVGYLCGITPVPQRFISLPPGIGEIWLHLDIVGALTWGFFSVILTVFIMDLVDTMGTLIGLSARAGLLDDTGNLPEIERPMLADAIATVAGALLGTTTTGTYIESAAGIEAGGRTGLTAVVTALLFLLGLFFAPLLTSIPAYAYGPALIVVGCLMLSVIQHIDFSDFTELVPAFVTITLMCFTYNLGIGITAGFVVYPVLKVCVGRGREVHPGMWGLCALSLLFYLVYPYQ
jgi:AGZA family xanthine/uracil permease-like MFS transporter